MTRAIRRHLQWRKVAQRLRYWRALGLDYGYWMKSTGTICSCRMCRNPRRWRGRNYVTYQEEKANLWERQQLEEFADDRGRL